MALHQYDSANTIEQSDLNDAQDASSRFHDGWKSAREHAKATEYLLVEVAQQLTVSQAKQARKTSRSKASDAGLLNARDAVSDQSSVAVNARRFLDVL